MWLTPKFAVEKKGNIFKERNFLELLSDKQFCTNASEAIIVAILRINTMLLYSECLCVSESIGNML